MIFHTLRRAALMVCSALLLAACGTTVPAKPALTVSTEVKNLLWVGNSFFYYNNNSMHGHVGQLLGAAGVRGTRATSATISGSGINWHDLEAHFRSEEHTSELQSPC